MRLLHHTPDPLWVAVALAGSLTTAVLGQESPTTTAAIQDKLAGRVNSAVAALEGLKAFRRILAVSSGVGKPDVGPGEIDKGSLGLPLDIYTVPLNRLAAYPDTFTPEALLTDTHRTVYQVFVDGKVRTAITLQKTDSGWVAVRFGDMGMINHVKAAFDTLAARNDTLGAYRLAVQIPAIRGMAFLGVVRQGRLHLVSADSVPEVGIVAGRVLSADSVFRLLAPLAKAIDTNGPR